MGKHHLAGEEKGWVDTQLLAIVCQERRCVKLGEANLGGQRGTRDQVTSMWMKAPEKCCSNVPRCCISIWHHLRDSKPFNLEMRTSTCQSVQSWARTTYRFIIWPYSSVLSLGDRHCALNSPPSCGPLNTFEILSHPSVTELRCLLSSLHALSVSRELVLIWLRNSDCLKTDTSPDYLLASLGMWCEGGHSEPLPTWLVMKSLYCSYKPNIVYLWRTKALISIS